jgi:hypothetical protein
MEGENNCTGALGVSLLDLPRAICDASTPTIRGGLPKAETRNWKIENCGQFRISIFVLASN